MTNNEGVFQIVTDKVDKHGKYSGERSKLTRKYDDLLKKGANSSSIDVRRVFAIKAKIVRHKIGILELKQLELMKDISGLLEEINQSKIQSFVDDSEIHSKITEASNTTPSDYQTQIDELKQTIQAELHKMESTQTKIKESVAVVRKYQRNKNRMMDLGIDEEKSEELSHKEEHIEVIIDILNKIAKAQGNIEDFDEIKFEFLDGEEESPKD